MKLILSKEDQAVLLGVATTLVATAIRERDPKRIAEILGLSEDDVRTVNVNDEPVGEDGFNGSYVRISEALERHGIEEADALAATDALANVTREHATK